MSVHSPDRPNAQWMADTGPAPVRLLLAGVEGEASALVGAKVAGFPLDLVIAEPAAPVDPNAVAAKIGDETITERDVEVAMKEFASELAQVPEEQRRSA